MALPAEVKDSFNLLQSPSISFPQFPSYMNTCIGLHSTRLNPCEEELQASKEESPDDEAPQAASLRARLILAMEEAE